MPDEPVERFLSCPAWPERIREVSSFPARCSSCGIRVAVAQSSADVLALGARVMCNACVAQMTADLEAMGEHVEYRRAWVDEEVE